MLALVSAPLNNRATCAELFVEEEHVLCIPAVAAEWKSNAPRDSEQSGAPRHDNFTSPCGPVPTLPCMCSGLMQYLT
jgi:hypothetical protein